MLISCLTINIWSALMTSRGRGKPLLTTVKCEKWKKLILLNEVQNVQLNTVMLSLPSDSRWRSVHSRVSFIDIWSFCATPPIQMHRGTEKRILGNLKNRKINGWELKNELCPRSTDSYSIYQWYISSFTSISIISHFFHHQNSYEHGLKYACSIQNCSNVG